jgi:hypothetical protein
MYEILTVFGSVVVKDVIEMIECCDIVVIRETWVNMNMNKHAECVDEILRMINETLKTGINS